MGGGVAFPFEAGVELDRVHLMRVEVGALIGAGVWSLAGGEVAVQFEG